MSDKKYNHLKQIRPFVRQLPRWSIGMLLAIAIILTDVQTPKLQAAQTNIDLDLKTELADIEKFSEMIDRLERNWESDYEGYFNRDFLYQKQSARKIANRLKEVRDKAGINPAVMWVKPGDDFLQVMLVTPERQFVVKKMRGANRELLDKRIQEFKRGIDDRQSLKYLPPARLIYNWIFRPMESYLETESIDTILMCTGEKLRSLPFSALHDGKQFVVEKYNLARIPAFNLTDTRYKSKPNRKVLAMGTSKFEDLPALPGVEIELETIVPKLWSGSKMVDRNFTVDNLLQAHQQGEYDTIHIASHSLFKPGSPKDSFIQFSDRRLSLAQIDELNLDLPPVDLLVLSACETALGNKDAEFGFAGLAMQAGVKSALASLWLIDDAGTVLLMSDFYQQLRSTPIKSAALRKAQMNLLQQKVTIEDSQIRGLNVEVALSTIPASEQTQDFTHPFYWAGFTVIGNPW